MDLNVPMTSDQIFKIKIERFKREFKETSHFGQHIILSGLTEIYNERAAEIDKMDADDDRND